jgi:CRP/FNR family cyclic AMP-dependent transcriptional regulator
MIEPAKLTLSDHALFDGLSTQQQAAIFAFAESVSFDTGQYIFHQGGAADRFYVITGGKVSLEMSDPGRGSLVVQTLTAGDVLGWSWIVKPYTWHFDARAIEPVTLLAFDAARIRWLFEAEYELGYRMVGRFMEILVQRLQATRLQLMDVYGNADSNR